MYFSPDSSHDAFTYTHGAGEHVTEEELVEHLMTLLGHSENPEVDHAFSAQPEGALQELPERITVTHFAEDLLGLTT